MSARGRGARRGARAAPATAPAPTPPPAPVVEPEPVQQQFEEAEMDDDAQLLGEGNDSESPVKRERQPHTYEFLRTKYRNRLRFLPNDVLHTIEVAEQQGNCVSPLEHQYAKLDQIEGIDNPEFVEKCVGSLCLTCDCCELKFEGSGKLRDMLNHIYTEEHKNALKSKLYENRLYAFELHKKNRQPREKKSKNAQKRKVKNGDAGDEADEATGDESPKKKKKKGGQQGAEQDGLSDDLKAMQDWVACYVCNTSCSSEQIFREHEKGKRHQKILKISPKNLQNTPYGPYIVNGKPTIDVHAGTVKLAIRNGETVRVEPGQSMTAPVKGAKPPGGKPPGGNRGGMQGGPGFGPRNAYAAQLWGNGPPSGWGPYWGAPGPWGPHAGMNPGMPRGGGRGGKKGGRGGGAMGGNGFNAGGTWGGN